MLVTTQTVVAVIAILLSSHTKLPKRRSCRQVEWFANRPTLILEVPTAMQPRNRYQTGAVLPHRPELTPRKLCHSYNNDSSKKLRCISAIKCPNRRNNKAWLRHWQSRPTRMCLSIVAVCTVQGSSTLSQWSNTSPKKPQLRR